MTRNIAPLAAMLLGSTALMASPALAQADPAPVKIADSSADSGNPANDIVVTGTRSSGRKAINSVSPIDVYSNDKLTGTGETTLTSALTQISPAVSTLNFGTDLGALTASIRLHGLSPDDTLVLVNGKRRHPSGYIYASPGPQQGSTGVDLDMIPISAIDHIELLRDGAAAQYGSDAVAGVVNIIMKSNAQGVSAEALTGGYESGGGLTGQGSADVGLKLGNGGFVNISGEVRYQDRTNRSGDDTRYNAPVTKAFGSPETMRESLGINAALPLGDAVTLYGFGTYSHRTANQFEFYRELPGVYANGYSPIDKLNENDFSGTGGIKGDDLAGFHWDLSSTYGGDNIDASMSDSANPSLYAATGSTPTAFDIGGYKSAQWTTNFDITRPLSLAFMTKPSTLSFGLEYRKDWYEIDAGEPDSYYGSGTSGLPGLPPTSAGRHHRQSYAIYGEWDLHPLSWWEVDLAGRGEHYSDVGTNGTGKVSTRVELAQGLALRGTFTNGFRAPSLAQEYFSNLGVSPSAASGQLAVNSQAARLLGAVPLKPERSTDLSAGIVASPTATVHVTLDAYQIKIRNRIVDGGTYSGQQAVNALAQGGFNIPSTVDPSAVSAQYYTNGADTRTRGVDMTADYVEDLGNSGAIDWSLALEVNRTKVLRNGTDTNGNPLLTAQDIAFLTTASAPADKVTLGANWKHGWFGLNLHEIRWGPMVDQVQYTEGPDAYSNSVFYTFHQKALYTTNIEISAQLSHGFRLSIGGDNVFNTKPTMVPADTRLLGVTVYDYLATPIGINGGYVYGKVNLTF